MRYKVTFYGQDGQFIEEDFFETDCIAEYCHLNFDDFDHLYITESTIQTTLNGPVKQISIINLRNITEIVIKESQ